MKLSRLSENLPNGPETSVQFQGLRAKTFRTPKTFRMAMPRCHDGFWASNLPSTQSPDECAHTLKRQRQGHHSHHHQKSLSGGATAKGELSWLRQTCLPPTLQLHNFIIIFIVVVLLLRSKDPGPIIVLPCKSVTPLCRLLTKEYRDLCKPSC